MYHRRPALFWTETEVEWIVGEEKKWEERKGAGTAVWIQNKWIYLSNNNKKEITLFQTFYLRWSPLTGESPQHCIRWGFLGFCRESSIGERLYSVLFSTLKLLVTFHAPVIQSMSLRVSWQTFIVHPKGMYIELLEQSLSPKSRLVTLKVWPLNL